MAIGAIALILSACGGETTENITNINQMGMDVVKSAKDLPECTGENEGAQAFVKGETSARICVDGEWFAMASNGGEGVAPDFSCKTEELKDGSGLKIVCNGDSIGVVLNGATGKGCDVADQADSTVTIVCGDKSITLNLGAGSVSVGTFVPDSEKVAISLDSLAGYSQKGPFLKGSTVYLYELSDGRTLKQTNGNFTSIITRDDGRYKFTARDLASQYAMVVVDGNYRNEVTGKPSNASIRLRALTDMRKRSNVNVNLLTHLEFDRVYYLVTREHKTVKQAKKQAQAEIFDAFHIDTTGFSKSSEDLDVFGSSDADAALLAISILLQGDRTETELTELLAELSEDLSDGKWDDAEKRAEIADSALSKDIQGKFANYRSNVKGWGLSTTVPSFEKHVRRFAGLENGLGVCGSDSIPVGTVKQVKNGKSKNYAKSYTDTLSVGGKMRFICVDADSAKWRVATDWEKDVFNWEPVNAKDGSLLSGPVSGRKMVWDADTLRYADSMEIALNKGCVSYLLSMSDTLGLHSAYSCMSDGWFFDSVNVITDSRDKQVYKTIKIGSQYWMAENLNYEISASYCYNDDAINCTRYGRLYTWAAAMDSAGTWTTNGKGCGNGSTCSPTYPVRGVCPSGWHLPSTTEWGTLIKVVGGTSTAGKVLKSTSGWFEDGNGTDTFGFSALPAGFREDVGNFYDYSAFFWSSTGYTSNFARFIHLYYNHDYANQEDNLGKGFGFSVRCLQD